MNEHSIGKSFVEKRKFIFEEYGLDMYHITPLFNMENPVVIEFKTMAETWENEAMRTIDTDQIVIGVDEHFNPMFPKFMVQEPTLWIETFSRKDIHDIKSIILIKCIHGEETMDVQFIQLIKNRPEKIKKLRRIIEDDLRKTKDPVVTACIHALLKHHWS